MISINDNQWNVALKSSRIFCNEMIDTATNNNHYAVLGEDIIEEKCSIGGKGMSNVIKLLFKSSKNTVKKKRKR